MAEFREGFLCPICMADLGDENQLIVHFDEKHSREDPAIIQNFKELFSKAKNKMGINKNEPEQEQVVIVETNDFSKEVYGREPSTYHPVSGIHKEILDENDSQIQVFDKFDQFRQERAKRVDIRTMDINKFIVRLEKLMTQLPSDPVKRRSHEQKVVPWINEKDVPRCPECASSFGMMKRRHHCRLCGGVMCEDCSDFVSFELAERLINPATISKFNQSNDAPKASPTKSKAQATYDGFVSNFLDFAGFAEDQRSFRCCKLCKEVLDKRDQRLRIKTAPDPDLVRYYSHLQKLLSQGEEMSQKYRKMAESLNNAESTYQIKEAQVLRLQVMKAAETVQAVSKKIEELPPDDAKCAKLQDRIRAAAMNFVKETLIGLPKTPTEQEFEEIKILKAQEAAKRIEEEKKSALEAKIKSESMKKQQSFSKTHILNAVSKKQLFPPSGTTPSKNTSKKDVKKIGQGFVASAGQETIDDDPLGQQIHNLKQFIKQAKAAGKYDDARILETNLKDLQEEHRRQTTELQQNYEDFKDLFSKPPKSNSDEHTTQPTNVVNNADNNDGTSGTSTSEEFDESNPFFDAQEEQFDESNPFKDESEDFDQYDKSGKNPYA